MPPERLLVWNLKDGWEPLCTFLNKPVPSEPVPRENTTGDMKYMEKFFYESKIYKKMMNFCMMYMVMLIVMILVIIAIVLILLHIFGIIWNDAFNILNKNLRTFHLYVTRWYRKVYFFSKIYFEDSSLFWQSFGSEARTFSITDWDENLGVPKVNVEFLGVEFLFSGSAQWLRLMLRKMAIIENDLSCAIKIL